MHGREVMLDQTHDKNQSDKAHKSGQNAWDRTDRVLFKTESGARL
jgi:hypothetical protein